MSTGAHTKTAKQPVHESAQSVSPTADRKVTVTGGAGPYVEILSGDATGSTLGAYLSRCRRSPSGRRATPCSG